MIEWQWYRLDELHVTQLYAICAAREAVFVVEQGCAYQELDGLDEEAEHLVAWSQKEVAAYLRLLKPGVKFPELVLGRIMTAKPYRGRGLGRQLLERALTRASVFYPGRAIRISAQSHLQDFYRKFGFETVSGSYLEDGIPHVTMLRMAVTSPS
ncbi:MAG: GNAT family N-acetyltransferase [Methylophilaceae bacterium]|nr:GNAT family N-acetyltransferase [Methylophilaceae bacterium]